MKAPKLEILVKAHDLLDDGMPMGKVLEATGLNYSQAWYFHRRCQVEAEGLNVEATPATVEKLRKANCSWGEIAVRCGTSESSIRNMFTGKTGDRSQGLRIGRGGRWFANHSGFYEAELARPGTRIPKGMKIEQAKAVAPNAQEVRLVKLDVEELQNLAKDLGVKFTQKTTKAQLAQKIRKAFLSAEAAK